MSKQSNWSKQGSYSVNDKIGSQSMPVEGTEAPRSFGEGTGKRKYDKNDPSVEEMRKRRSRIYSHPTIGMPWGSTTSQSKKKTIKTKKHKKRKLSKSVPGQVTLKGGAKVMIVKRKSGIMRGFK